MRARIFATDQRTTGKSIRLLELFGLAGIKNLNDYYKSRSSKKFENLNLINEKNKSDKFSFCPITLGISFLDQIRTLEKFNKISFSKISYPLLILPFLSRSSEIIGKKYISNLINTNFY